MTAGSFHPAVDSQDQPSGLSRQVAYFVQRSHWCDIPVAVRHQAKRALLNYCAVCLAGSQDPDVAKAVELFQRFRSGPAARLIGRAERTDILNAASLNAMSANVYDFDDTHIPTIIHPTAPVAAGLFALADSTLVSGQALLLAFVLGVEVECRLGLAMSPGHYQRGWHITSTCGVFGAAAGVAKLLGLNQRQHLWALGNASAQSSGLVETLGSASKSIGVGNAARNGLLSALLAERGFAGPEQPLEGERGFLRVMAESADFSQVSEGLGERWALLANTYKPYPCGVVLNPVIEACLALSGQCSGSMQAISRIELIGHPLLRERTDRPNIRSGRESQVSAQHAVAVCLMTGKAGLAQFSDDAVADPALRALYPKLVFIDSPTESVDSAEVRIFLDNGQTINRRVAASRGSLAAPLSDGDLENKLRELARHVGSGCDVQALIDAVWAMDTAPDASLLMQLAATD